MSHLIRYIHRHCSGLRRRPASVWSIVLFALLLVTHNCVLVSQTTKPEWRFTTSLPLSLSGHRAVTLHTGDVLVCGGLNSSGNATNTSLLYRDAQWTQTSNLMNNARTHHALIAVRKANGESIVFAIGGYSGSSGSYSSLASVEVLQFNAAQNSWSWRIIGNLPAAVGGCAAAYDKKRYIVVSGGRIQNAAALSTGVPTVVSSRIDVNSLVIEKIGDLASARSEHSTLMLNGARGDSTVLSANGELNNTPATEILNLTAWDARANPPAFQQRNASSFTDLAEVARMVGGVDATGVQTSRGQWYDTKSGWRAMPRMQTARSRAFITLIAGIRDTSTNYLIVGGESGATSTGTCEIFSLPNSGTPNGAWSPFSTMNTAAAERTINIEASNLALVSGGRNVSTGQSSAELFQPLSANDLSFGQEEVGRESPRTIVKFQNTWLLPVMLYNLRIPGSAEFRLTNARDSIVIAPGGSIDVDVRFRPNTIGPRSTYLLANVGGLVDSVLLQGEGIKSTISVLSNIIDFNAHLVLTDTTICFDAIRNDGKDTTVIDSVVIDPVGVFTVVSPIGRTRIAPGATMRVCIKFKPDARKTFGAGADIHIADRLYPVSLSGIGIRRTLTTTSQSGCDTVSVAPGSSIPYDLIVSNNSDLAVLVDSTVIKTSLNGTFSIAPPSPFPFTLRPGENKKITIIFAPQREAEEKGTIQFVNNGDTVCIARLCFIPRNRSVNINIPQTKVFSLCEGDSVSIPIVLENPGNFDALVLDTVYVQNMPGTVSGFTKVTLKPRETTSFDVTFVPSRSGIQQGTVVVLSNQGQSQSSVPLTVLPAMKFSIDDTVASIGTQVSLTVRRSDNLSTTNSTKVAMHYNGSVLFPRTIRNVAGKNYINEQTSSVSASFGIATLDLRWNSHPASADKVFEIVCDVLRGDDARSDVSLQSDSGSSICVQQSTASVSITNLCGGRNSLVNVKSATLMMMAPSPASDVVQLHIVSPSFEAAEIRLLNVTGDVISRVKASSQTIIDCQQFSSGVYMCQFVHDGTPILSMPITILR